MSARVLSVGVYATVLLVLLALTVLTVSVSFLPLSGGAHIAAGLTIGLVKASLVALVFMHVISSPRLTWIVIVVALFWLVLLFGLIFCDYATRGLITSMPGH
ncbi:MAG TPA: cytochrome C oxidase subunit IV family protein [Pirellulales bacterium]|jgi:cytochrome c oxidase subunit 4